MSSDVRNRLEFGKIFPKDLLWMNWKCKKNGYWEFDLSGTLNIFYSFHDIFVMPFPFTANQLKATQREIQVNITTKVIGSQGMTLLNLYREREKKLLGKPLEWWRFQPVNQMELQISLPVTKWRQLLAQQWQNKVN